MEKNSLNYTNYPPINTKKFFLAFIVFLVLLLMVWPSKTKAAEASLYLSPSSGTFAADSSFKVVVKVNSGGKTINAAEAILTFDPSKLSVIDLSKTGSIFSLWATEPAFSNSTGNIVFGGGTPTPFNGTSGTIITITFMPKTSGFAQVSFSSGSVLAADGKGTNILANMKSGFYTIRPKVIIPSEEGIPSEQEYLLPGIPEGVPLAPIVQSSTHPDPDKWYSNNDPEFSWNLPSDVTAVKLLIGHLPTAVPTVLYSPPISEKKIEDLADGVWYFHIRFKNKYGWGAILHRKVLIDTVPPEPFEIKVNNQEDPTNPSPILCFEAEDLLSGIEYYEIKIDEGDFVKLIPDEIEKNPYKIPPQLPGKHTVIVKAVDKAENSTLAIAEFEIEPLEAPVITDFTQRIDTGETLIIKGISLYPQATITLFVKKEKKEPEFYNTKTDTQGNWVYIHPKSLEKGTYQVWAQVIDNRGAKSNPTEKITIVVALPPLLKFGKIAINYLSIIITLVVLIFVLIGIIFYGWFRILESRKRLRRETKEVAQSVTGAFKALRQEVQEQIEYLDKKPGLSKREKEIRDKLKEALDISEKFIDKEIKDIEKELH